MKLRPLEPALGQALREGYSRSRFLGDLSAGVLVGIVALPLSIAIAIASGVSPAQGLVTAVVAGLLISALSGSRYQIGGPTGAFIVLVFQIVQEHGYEGLATATLMAGVILMLMGLARFGQVIQYIPYPVTVGFTSGIAVLIGVTQVRDLFGLRMDAVPAEFLEKMRAFATHAHTVDAWAVGLGLGSLAIVVWWPRITRKIPGSLVAVIGATAIVQGFDLPVETIGSRFGAFSSALPMPRLPDLDFGLIRELMPAATAIALLAGIESLLSAVIADGMTGRKHDANMELVAQGVANVASPLFLGLPATGAIARTAANIKNGGTTPISGMVHALTLLVIMLLFGKWAALIPMPTLAAILVLVAYNMGEWHLFRGLLRAPRSDVLVLLTTFLLTVLVDLIVAIEVGVVLAALLFTKRMAEVAEAGFVTVGEMEGRVPHLRGASAGSPPSSAFDADALEHLTVPAGVEIFELAGPFFFGAADKFKDALARVQRRPRVLILRMRHVPVVDSTGIHALEELHEKTHRDGTALVLSGVRPGPLRALQRAGFVHRIGLENVHGNIHKALERAEEIVGESRRLH